MVGATVVVPAVVYLATAPRDVLGGDVGELATLAVTGGVGHPPGYPLYALYVHAMRWLPGSPAHAAALASGILACVAIAALVAACRAWGASATASCVAAAAWALAPITWAQATAAEVFTMNALFAAVILWLAAPAPPLPPARTAIGLALIAGLALSNHHTIVGMAPVGLLAAVTAVRRCGRRAVVVAAAAVGAFAIGLVPYAYLLAVHARGPDPSTWSWGDVHDWSGLVATIRRDEYTWTMKSLLPSPSLAAAQLGRIVVELLGLPLVILAALAVGLRRRAGATRWLPWGALALAFVLCGPAPASLFGLSLTGIPGVVTERLDVLPAAVAVPAIAVALDVVARRAPAALRTSVVAGGALAIVMMAGLVRGVPDLRARHRPTVAQYGENALVVAPPGAVILGLGDARLGSFVYARYALDMRPDVVFVNPRMLLAPWYHERIERALGMPLPPVVNRELRVVPLVDALLGSGRPVFITDDFAPAALAQVPSYPVGPLVRLVTSWRDVPAPDHLAAMNLDLAHHFAYEPAPVPGPEPWCDELLADYARPWRALADYARAHGEPDDARENDARAARALAGLPPDAPQSR
ncbi:MAG TPA: DUF2723 domain-containing protein [Polyangiaceae bacterium]